MSKVNLLFVHGFRGNGAGLKEMAEKYFDKKKYNVYVPSIPPAGGNSMREYTPLSYAKFIADYIKRNNIEKPALIGHSMGSIVSAAVAERYPELIADKIIFLSPISAKPAAFFASLTPLSAVLPNGLITYIITKYMFIPKDKQLFQETLAVSKVCGADYVSKSEVFKSAKFSSHHAISDFDLGGKKACFISGEHDRLIPKEKTDALALKLNAPSIYIAGAGHLINYEKPKETTAAIKRFLSRK